MTKIQGKKEAREGVKAIRIASRQLETFLWNRKLELSDMPYFDRGDMKLKRKAFAGGGRIAVFDTVRRKKIFIGGNHSISYPLVKELFRHGEVAKVIV